MKPIILIFDEHDETKISVCEWLTGVLSEYCFLEAKNLKEALAIVRSQPPDMVLIRIDLLQGDYLKDIREIKSAAPTTQIVVMATHENEVYQTETPAEVSAYILKDGLTSFLKRILPFVI
ncbi:MAG: response regulator [Deltaproteobacteria bacterium]|nr:response regulator [Deltaproteobacteria bacterium]